MSRRDPFQDVRGWSRGGPKPAPESMALFDEKGFGALHALAEEESVSERGAAFFERLSQEALDCGAGACQAEFEIGNTPLHWCAWHPAPGCALALISAGAAQGSNRVGESPEQIAIRLLGPASSMPAPRRAKLLMLAQILRSQRERVEIGEGLACAFTLYKTTRI